MLRNLNQVGFREFGAIVSERGKTSKSTAKGMKRVSLPEETEVPAYRTKAETRIECVSGMAVLSVSLDNQTYFDYYLDKPVIVREKVYFAVLPFKGSCVVEMKSRVAATEIGTHTGGNMRVDGKLRVDGIYTFFYQEKEQGFLFSGEAHSMPELTYVDKGSIHAVVDGHDFLLKQGDVMVYGPNQWHMLYSDIGVAPSFVNISFDLSGGDITPLLNRKITAPQQVVGFLQNMLQEQERMDAFSNDMIQAKLLLLLLVLMRQLENPEDAKLQTANAVQSENQIIRQAQMFIAAHIREKLSVPRVAKHVDVSPSYLTALFHKNLQISPGEYIRRIKLQESKQMIRENDLNFTEIAAALQYSTVHHFSRQFKEKFGITPTEYAKSVR